MSINTQEALKLIQGAQFNQSVKGWNIVNNEFKDLTNTKSGFDAVVFKQGNKIVIAMPGMLSPKDALNAFSILTTKGIPAQNMDARSLHHEVARKYANHKIEFVGYSLGATNASLMSQYTGLPATALAPIGSKHIIDAHPDIFTFSDKNIRTYGRADDAWFMKNINRQSGEIFLFPNLKERVTINPTDFWYDSNAQTTALYLKTGKDIKNNLGPNHFLHYYKDVDFSGAKRYEPNLKSFITGQAASMVADPSIISYASDLSINNYVLSDDFDINIPSEYRFELLAQYDKINQPKTFKETLTDKLGQAKDFLATTAMGIAMGLSSFIGGVQGLVEIIKAPAKGPLGWLEKTLGILNSGLGLISLGAGLMGGLGNSQITYPKQAHTGERIPGHSEALRILKGGEMVRTEAQEDELQQTRHEELLSAIAPLLEEEEEEDHVPGRPLFFEQTEYDKDMIIHIVAQAYKNNYYGLRTAFRGG